LVPPDHRRLSRTLLPPLATPLPTPQPLMLVLVMMLATHLFFQLTLRWRTGQQ
jgi:hypothetical protein